MPPTFLTAELPPIAALLQVLGVAEWQKAHVGVEGGPHTAAEAVCLFYDELCAAEPAPEAFAALIHTEEILPRIYHVHAQQRVIIASVFFRLQEFYESADTSIRGHSFSVADYRQRCASYRGVFDFYLSWPGFNLPSRIVEAVRSGAIGTLHPREQALLDSIDAAKGDIQGEYYVIGTCEDGGALEHEIAHGLYAVNDAYRHDVQALLAKVSDPDKAAMRQKLLEMGYCDDDSILLDEMQAYMAGGEDLLFGRSPECAATKEDIRQTLFFFARVHNTPYGSPW